MPEQAVEPRARLAYVLGQFPSVSETFILREMRALEDLGFHITPLSMEPGSETVHGTAAAFAARTVYRPKPFSWASLGSIFIALLHKPFGWLSALMLVLRRGFSDPSAMRELCSAFAAACYFVVHIRPGQMRHIHAHFATYPSTVGLLLAEILGVGFSMSCHARDIFTEEARLLSAKVAEAEFVTVCTAYGAEALQKRHSMLKSDKLRIIRHGIDFDTFRVGPHVDHRAPLIVSVGRLIEKKGFPILLRAAAMLASEGVDFELAIIGDGPLREELERLSNGLGLGNRVFFPGYMPIEELYPVYQRADVFVLTPVVAADGDREGLPNTILEAMTANIPVVATDVGAISEAVSHETTGLLAHSGDIPMIASYMERALLDAELRETVVRNAQRLVHHEYDAVKNATQLGSLFAEILALRQWPPVAGEGSRISVAEKTPMANEGTVEFD